MNWQQRFFLTRWANRYYEAFFFAFLLLMAFAIPTSRLLMSISQFALAGLWVLNGNFAKKLKLFFTNKIALLLSAVFLLHLIGMTYTNQFAPGLKDLRIKLPLLLLPFFMSSVISYSRKKIFWVLLAFIAGVLYASIFVGVEHFFGGADIKTLLSEHFIKHMRFSLGINLAIFSLLLFVFYEKKKVGARLLLGVFIVWLLLFMFWMGALSAYILALILSLFLLAFFAWTYSGKKRVVVLGVFIVLSSVVVLGINRYCALFFPEKQNVIVQQLDKTTVNGNAYYHLPEGVYEQGKAVYIYICEKELQTEWAKRSPFSYKGKDKKGQELKSTLFRYMTSLNLRKDSLGMTKLSNKDIRQIEEGIANAQYVSLSGFKLRLMQLAFELEQTQDKANPSGYSLAQRIEFWKVARYAIKQKWLIGYGTGGNDAAMQKAYAETKSPLNKQFWFGPHNQFLSIWLSFGVFGFLFFLFALVYPPIVMGLFKNPYYWLFFLTVLLGFMVEDVLETQSGVTYFAFFNTFFLLLDTNRGNKKSRK